MAEGKKWEKYLDKFIVIVAIFLAGVLIGRCRLFSINSLGVGYFGAICLTGIYIPVAFVGILLGMLASCTISEMIKYAIVMFIIGILIRFDSINFIRNRERLLPVCFGLVSLISGVAGYFALSNPDSLFIVVMDGMLVYSSTMIFYYAIKTLKEDYVKICVENEALISVTLFAAAILYGMPDKLFDVLVIRESFAIFLILYFLHRFGMGIGITYCVIGGVVLGYTNQLNYITPWVLTTVIAFGISVLIGKNRIILAVCFSAVYYVLGFFMYGTLLEIDSLKAIITAVVLFLLMPAGLMYRLDENIRHKHDEIGSAEWGRWILNRIENLSDTFRRLDYSYAGEGGLGIGLGDVSSVIDDFAGKTATTIQPKKIVEGEVVEALTHQNVSVKDFFVKKFGDGKNEVYITLKSKGRKICTTESVRKILASKMGIGLVSMPENRTVIGNTDALYGFREKPAFKCISAVRKLSRNESDVSGDNYYIGEATEGQQLIMLSDGMGNGINAYNNSNELLEIVQELMQAGFNQQLAIKVVNTFVTGKNRGEMFSTLDMIMIDMYTGYARVYKCGACLTLVMRKDWIEIIKSTSLPIGITEEFEFESSIKKIYDGDVIIMISDGVLENIDLEDKEKYIIEFIKNSHLVEPEDIVSEISRHIKSLNGKQLKDDATIIATKLRRC